MQLTQHRDCHVPSTLGNDLLCIRNPHRQQQLQACPVRHSSPLRGNLQAAQRIQCTSQILSEHSAQHHQQLLLQMRQLSHRQSHHERAQQPGDELSREAGAKFCQQQGHQWSNKQTCIVSEVWPQQSFHSLQQGCEHAALKDLLGSAPHQLTEDIAGVLQDAAVLRAEHGSYQWLDACPQLWGQWDLSMLQQEREEINAGHRK
mmetsp:Transcript_9268/g.17040  ORF Transcript_9268/g.17040 Transcript_9268/m.17040 type:complete len:203 (+) Transcript_9268:298-906(+)